MKSWQVLFREAKRESDTQGESTGDEDFPNEAEDDALAAEGEAELGEETSDDEEAESEDDDEQAEAQDDDEEEEAEEEEDSVEEEEPSFRFKNAQTGDFDFKRINKVLGGGELESYFKEQNATITRTSQELKSYKDLGAPPQELKARSVRAGFLDKMYNENPVIRGEVDRILYGREPAQGGGTGAGIQLPEGVDPKDPLAQPLIAALKQVEAISNRLQVDDRQKQYDAQERRFSVALQEGAARFKELTGKAMTQEQATLVDQEMRETGYANAAKLIPGLFFQEIQDAAAAKLNQKRMVKKNLPKTSSKGRSPAPGKQQRLSRRDNLEKLWKEHMGGNDED